MAIVVSDDQNVIIVDGVKVVAVPVSAEWEDDDSGCDGCYFSALGWTAETYPVIQVTGTMNW